MRRTVSCRLHADVTAPSDVVFAVAVSGATEAETMSVTCDDVALVPVELDGGHATRLHRAQKDEQRRHR
jgi:hypothetical protein